jgi:hypothetical protein
MRFGGRVGSSTRSSLLLWDVAGSVLSTPGVTPDDPGERRHMSQSEGLPARGVVFWPVGTGD